MCARKHPPEGDRQPPPAVDSWDAVVPPGPRAPRWADPWAPATEPEQEMWTPPVDAVQDHGIQTGGSDGSALPRSPRGAVRAVARPRTSWPKP